jgi:hypothetical protein
VTRDDAGAFDTVSKAGAGRNCRNINPGNWRDWRRFGAHVLWCVFTSFFWTI